MMRVCAAILGFVAVLDEHGDEAQVIISALATPLPPPRVSSSRQTGKPLYGQGLSLSSRKFQPNKLNYKSLPNATQILDVPKPFFFDI
jgi:hypothetical protein